MVLDQLMGLARLNLGPQHRRGNCPVDRDQRGTRDRDTGVTYGRSASCIMLSYGH